MSLRDKIGGRRSDLQGTASTHYRMRQKMIAIGDDFWIENDAGDKVFKVNGKAMRLRKTMILEDLHGRELLKMQEKVFHLRETMEIEDPRGHTVATVKKRMITPLREHWVVEVEDGPEMRVKGNIVDHEYRLEVDGDTVAEVSKRWFRVRDTYGVGVGPGQDAALVLAIAAVLDATAHEHR